MNQHPGVIGRKLGMTQIFAEDGTAVPCTVIEAGSLVVGKRTREKDGYDALILGFGTRRDKLVSKSILGQLKKANVPTVALIKEFRCHADVVASFEIGKSIALSELFEVGQFVDVAGRSRGRGFTGVMRRHNFKGNVRTHGTHEYKRHGGSIGSNMTPGRTLPGKRMPGQYGNASVTVVNQRIVKIVEEEAIVVLRGCAPGARNSLVTVRGAVKKGGGRPRA